MALSSCVLISLPPPYPEEVELEKHLYPILIYFYVPTTVHAASNNFLCHAYCDAPLVGNWVVGFVYTLNWEFTLQVYIVSAVHHHPCVTSSITAFKTR